MRVPRGYAVSPVGIFVGEADDQTSQVGVDRWASAFGCGRLGPVPCDKSTMPSQNRLRSDNQERRCPARAIHGIAQESEDRAVGFVEPRPVDLALQHEDLVSERKDLRVSGVAAGEDPADSGENEACERGKQVHESSTIPISTSARNPQEHWPDDFSAPSGKDRAVGIVESRSVDLALQHEDLVSERKDLSVSGVTGGEYPSDSGENEARESGKQVHKSSTIPTSTTT